MQPPEIRTEEFLRELNKLAGDNLEFMESSIKGLRWLQSQEDANLLLESFNLLFNNLGIKGKRKARVWWPFIYYVLPEMKRQARLAKKSKVEALDALAERRNFNRQ
jgi:hypothetical protein